jgi:HD-like signal output (HDOD) protein
MSSILSLGDSRTSYSSTRTVAVKPVVKPSNWPALRAKLKELLLERIASGRLILPAMPVIAAKVMDILEVGAHQAKVAALLEQDPVLALEVLRLANSASFGARARVESITHAITLLGATRLRSLLLTAAARRVFVSRNRAIRDLTSMLWCHSVGVAVVSRQIAVHSAIQDKEQTYLAGLMHDIGKPIVAVHMLDLERSLARGVQDRWIEPNDWLSIVQEVHHPVSVAVAKAWNMAPEIAKAIQDCVEFDPIERLCASNAVRFANALAERDGLHTGAVDMEQVETVLLIGRSMLGLDDAAVSALSSSLQAAAENTQAFGLSSP